MDLQTLLKHTSRSLYLSVQMLPANIRPAFGLAYLLCRYADTIADTPLLPAEQRVYWIQVFPHIVRTQDVSRQKDLTLALTGASDNPYETALITHLTDCLQALDDISAKQREFIYDVVEAVCAGMKLDLMTFPLSQQELRAFDLPNDLTHYCRLMGGKPGLFWSRIIYHTCRVQLPENDFYEQGQNIGDALQIVNILRDLPKDLRAGRCYIPLADLTKEKLTPQALCAPENSAAFKPIEQKWMSWGKHNLTNAFTYFRAIPKKNWRVRAAVAWPILWTADTFKKLAQTPDLLDASKRVKISRARIYATLLATPLLLLSNRLFDKWLTYKLKALP